MMKLRLRGLAKHSCSSAINWRNLHLNPGLSDTKGLPFKIPMMVYNKILIFNFAKLKKNKIPLIRATRSEGRAAGCIRGGEAIQIFGTIMLTLPS